ncbi:glutathione S-transferase family protein [Luteithermobacter gelatinilyticus]|uniref:glutathione S-transferase family protein n=1 Tax=Luteithermobacter gelatinilyticus TaxID=2582913 RepID=UPI0011063090|nr:glutathione S-transferase family protein [Luteithermobacter gelatinilyticus]
MSDTSLVFYTNPMSRGRIVRWMLEETGVAYDTRVIDYGPAMKSADYLAINPMGKVPALRHGDMIVTECAAICAYLADAFPEAGLAPPPARRGAYYRWLFFGAGPMEAALTNKALGVEVPADQQRMAGYGTYENVIDTLAYAVSQSDYIAGEKFSAADVYVGAHVGWGIQFGTMPERPEFIAYWDRLKDRPACRRAKELDDQLTPQQDHT